MAGYTSRILITSVSSLVAVLTTIWYLRKKKNFSFCNSLAEVTLKLSDSENPNDTLKRIEQDTVSMNFTAEQGTSLAYKVTSCTETLASEKMHLKDKNEGDVLDKSAQEGSSQAELNGNTKKSICNGSHVHENGNTCAASQGISTNGTSLSKYDKASDMKDCSESKVSEVNGDSFRGKRECDIASELTNGIQSLSLDKDVLSNVDMLDSDEKDNSKTALCYDKRLHSIKDESSTEILLVSDITESNDNLPSIVDITHDDSDELSCQTSFERKALTPDSGVSAELQECDSSSSSVSEPLSDCHLNGLHNDDVPKSPVTSVSSNDSGKDCTETHFEDENAAASADNNDALNSLPSQLAVQVYEFEIPHELCGFLIGKNGRHVKYIHQETNAEILIQTHPLFSRLKVCRVSGTEEEIKYAVALIRERFPEERYPELSLEPINPLQTECTLPVTVRLSLPEGVNFDAILSSTVSPGHFFLQQPTHPTYHTLSWLSECMTSWYSQYEAPRLFRITCGNVVAAPMCAGWYRAQVVDLSAELDECTVKFLDFGGYSTLPTNLLRQMRIEFTYVPFQAVECFLGSVTYPEGQDAWSDSAKTAFEELAQGQILQGYIVGYDGEVPYVHLFKVQGASTVFINRELVNQGLARWTDQQPQLSRN